MGMAASRFSWTILISVPSSRCAIGCSFTPQRPSISRMQNTQRSRRFQIYLACALLLGFSLSLRATVADPVQRTIQPSALHPELRTILSTATSVTGELLQYPSGGPALMYGAYKFSHNLERPSAVRREAKIGAPPPGHGHLIEVARPLARTNRAN